MEPQLRYIQQKLLESERIELSSHLIERSKVRGADPEKIKEALKSAKVMGFQRNENPNIGIEYSQTYKLLVKVNNSLFIIPVYFQTDRVLATTVLKLSKSNTGLKEW